MEKLEILENLPSPRSEPEIIVEKKIEPPIVLNKPEPVKPTRVPSPVKIIEEPKIVEEVKIEPEVKYSPKPVPKKNVKTKKKIKRERLPVAKLEKLKPKHRFQ